MRPPHGNRNPTNLLNCIGPRPTSATSVRLSHAAEAQRPEAYVLALRHVQQVNLIAWSLGGPRAGGYAAQHPGEGAEAGLPGPGL